MTDETKPDPDRPTKIGIYYQRSRHYRTIHADGAQIGLTPRGTLQFTLYSDQKPMPEFVLHGITPEGNLGGVLEEVVKEGFVREVEVNVVMDLTVTANFIAALQDVLTRYKAVQKQAAQEQTAKQAEQQELKAEENK